MSFISSKTDFNSCITHFHYIIDKTRMYKHMEWYLSFTQGMYLYQQSQLQLLFTSLSNTGQELTQSQNIPKTHISWRNVIYHYRDANYSIDENYKEVTGLDVELVKFTCNIKQMPILCLFKFSSSEGETKQQEGCQRAILVCERVWWRALGVFWLLFLVQRHMEDS